MRRYHKVGGLEIRCLVNPENGVRRAVPNSTVRQMREAEV
jgi:hypothetical protein